MPRRRFQSTMTSSPLRVVCIHGDDSGNVTLAATRLGADFKPLYWYNSFGPGAFVGISGSDSRWIYLFIREELTPVFPATFIVDKSLLKMGVKNKNWLYTQRMVEVLVVCRRK